MSGLDKLLGSTNAATSSLSGTQTFTITTAAAAAPKTRIAVALGWYSALGVSDCTGFMVGGQAAHRDLSVFNGNRSWLEVWSSPTLSGLSLGSAITATFNIALVGDVQGIMMGSLSMSGVDLTDGGGVLTTGSNGAGGTPSAWTTNPVNNSLAGFAFGGVENSAGGSQANTESSGTQAYDIYQAGDQDETVVVYQNLPSPGSVTFAGTFGANGFGYEAGMVIYSAIPTPGMLGEFDPDLRGSMF